MVQTNRIKTIAIVGCTAVGKSNTALRLAAELNGELIGADSMQIYRGFNIGTGKLTKQECGGIAHKLIDVVDGNDDYSVGEYVSMARQEIEDTALRGKLPIVVGGTGLYVYSLFSGNNFADTPKNKNLRNSLKLLSHFFGPFVIHMLLEYIDTISASKIEINDCKRVIRALEIFLQTGKPKSSATSHGEKPYDDLTIVLTLPRDLLYEKINMRVHKMFDDGLISEVKSLMAYKNCGAMQALGYKQIAENPDESREYLEDLTARKTRNYAKRQITYFKNVNLNKKFIDARDYNAVKKTVCDFLENRIK